MRPITIEIEKSNNYPLHIDEIKYVFQTLLIIAGSPWHFVSPEKVEHVDIYFGKSACKNARLFIEMTNIRRRDITIPTEFLNKNDIILLLFNGIQRRKIPINRTQNQSIHINNDIIFAAFYLLSGWQEQFVSRDKKDRHNIQESFLYDNLLLHTPIINQYALFIRETFQKTHRFISTWPSDQKYAVALSHDVDYPEMIRWIETLRYMVKYKQKTKLAKIFDILKGRESFWKFEDWIRLEQNYHFKSTFYFCGYKGTLLRYILKAPDPFYDVRQAKFKSIMDYIVRCGFEVGMHGSYFAYRSVDQMREEKNRLENILGKNVLGNRHHYWHMDPDNPVATALLHDKIGLLYDSSICFEKHSGFRYSICSPFHLYDRIGNRSLFTLQIPTTLMDDHLFNRSKYSYFKQYQSHIDSLLHSIKKYEGVFVADYHIRVLNNVFFPQWNESYKYLLKKITKDCDFYPDTLIGISNYWLDREKKIRKISKSEI